jgi:osmotically-inducible protein OsmY
MQTGRLRRRVLFFCILISLLLLIGCVAKQAKDIEVAILDAPLTPPYDLEVAQIKSGIHLDGFVSCYEDREQAIRIAKECAGYRAVVPNIHIHRPKRTVRRHVTPSDRFVRSEVLNIGAKYENQGLSVKDVVVQSGVVTVAGDAKTFQAVDEFLSRIRNTLGVTEVNSQMTINGGEYMSLWGKYRKDNQ